MRSTLFLLSTFLSCPAVFSQALYFPPSVSGEWDTLSPQSLHWCQDELDTLLNFAGNTGTKAFLILKDGKMVIEKYYGSFSQDSIWYWASAGKSLTGFITGIAQQEGHLSIDDTSAAYLGSGWTSCPPGKEAMIRIRDQLSMTSGLDDAVADPDCTHDSCLKYLADASSRWAYHNAPYHLLQDVVAAASGVNFQLYTNQKIKNKIGMSSGVWINYSFYSKARDMARFGLLNLANGNWNGQQLLSDTAYLWQMKNTSQAFNQSYGYLWWLNGKSTYMLPQSQFVFPGKLIPEAPSDVYAALGKNDQKIYIAPSYGLVVVRMGNSAGQSMLALSSYDNQLWKRIMALYCNTSALEEGLPELQRIGIYPNPASDMLYIRMPGSLHLVRTEVYSAEGKPCLSGKETQIPVAGLRPGIYLLRIITEEGSRSIRFLRDQPTDGSSR